MKRLAIFAFLSCHAANALEAPPPLELARETPRPFGHVIGDAIEHRLLLRLPAGCTLDPLTLPAGRLNHWLEARVERVRAMKRGEEASYDIRLRFQPFAGPLETRMLTLPGYGLDYRCGERRGSAAVAPWSFTLSPLHSLRGDDDTPLLRADAPARPRPLGGLWRRCALWLTGGIAFGLAWLDGSGRLGRRPRPFAVLWRRVRDASFDAADAATARDRFRQLHRAFDACHGAPLFAERLEDFLARNPCYAPLRDEITAFYAASYQVFFAAADPLQAYPAERFRALCRALRDAERSG